jgi:lysozyme
MSKETDALTDVPFETILAELRDEEGERLRTYRCTAGFLTVGIGHNLDAKSVKNIIGREITAGRSISTEESAKIFEDDLISLLRSINKNLPWFRNVDKSLQYVLISMVFNMGMAGVLKFKNTLKAFEAENTAKIISGMNSSAWAKQVPNRVAKLAAIVKDRRFS